MTHPKIEVLDHGFVRLIDSMGSDLAVVRNARVSYDAAWRAGEDSGGDEKLLRYLYKNGHNTPFESVTFTFEVKAPIFVLRQWHRHRTQSFNELSARYKELPQEFYVPEINNITTQSDDNKQMRTQTVHPYAAEFQILMREKAQDNFIAYHTLLKEGCPRELARTILPLSTYSHMFVTVNLNNLFKFLSERLHEHAQFEIAEYAKVLLKIIDPIVPICVKNFKKGLGEGYPMLP